MTQTGILPDLPADEYHAGPTEPALSASIIKVILQQSPLHAWWRHPRLNPQYAPEQKDSFDLGTAVHDLFLRGIDSMAVAPFDSWRSNEAKAHREAARAAGKIPMLEKHEPQVRAMVAAIRDQLAARDDDPPLFADGKPEQSITWREKGVLCKARLDWLHDSHLAVDDLKTSGQSSNPHDYNRRTFWQIGCDVQARFYQRGIKALTGNEPIFRFCVVETEAPFCLSVLDLAPSAIELADQKIDKALSIWARCLEDDHWPGYDSRVASVEAGWAASDFVERFWEDEND